MTHWRCPKCGKRYKAHKSNRAAWHRCNPNVPRVTQLAAEKDDE